MTILFLCWRARFSKSRMECSKAKSTSYGEKILPLDNSGVEQKYESSPSFWICCYCYSLIGNNQFQVFSGRHKKRNPFVRITIFIWRCVLKSVCAFSRRKVHALIQLRRTFSPCCCQILQQQLSLSHTPKRQGRKLPNLTSIMVYICAEHVFLATQPGSRRGEYFQLFFLPDEKFSIFRNLPLKPCKINKLSCAIFVQPIHGYI